MGKVFRSFLSATSEPKVPFQRVGASRPDDDVIWEKVTHVKTEWRRRMISIDDGAALWMVSASTMMDLSW